MATVTAWPWSIWGSTNCRSAGPPVGRRPRTVVAFDLTGVRITGLRRVTLRLTLAEPATGWGGQGRLVSVHRLVVPFAEGNGQWFDLPGSTRTRGNGPGVTWNCAVDGEIANTMPDCGTLWNGGSTAAGPASASAR